MGHHKLFGGRHTADRITATVLLAVAILLLVTSIRYGLYRGGRPGSGLFPAITAGALAVVALAWLITGAGPTSDGDVLDVAQLEKRSQDEDDIRPNEFLAEDPDEWMPEDESIDRAGARRIIYVVAATSIPILLMERIGFILMMTIYVSVLLVVIARVRARVAVVGVLVGSVLAAWGSSAVGIVLPDPFELLSRIGL